MSESNSQTNPTAEQWAAMQKIWSETFSKLIQLGFTCSPESAPPELLRQMRSGVLQALSQSWDQFLRSPQFMESTRQWMEQAIAFRKLSSDFFSKVRHETQATTREDIDSVMLAVRHMETRILDRVEDLAAEMAALKQQLGASAGVSSSSPGPEPSAARPGRSRSTRSRSPRRK